jgi:hypothetical protein
LSAALGFFLAGEVFRIAGGNVAAGDFAFGRGLAAADEFGALGGRLVGEVTALAGKGIDGDDGGIAPLERAMRGDEGARAEVIAIVASVAAPLHADAEVLAHFKMEMGVVLSVSGADGADLLSFAHRFVHAHGASVEMAVEAIDRLQGAFGITIGVADDDDISPPAVVVFGENNDAIGGGINGITEVGIAAAVTVPVFALVAIRRVAAKDIIANGGGIANRGDKTISDRHSRGVARDSGEGWERGEKNAEERERGSMHRLGRVTRQKLPDADVLRARGVGARHLFSGWRCGIEARFDHGPGLADKEWAGVATK